MKPSWLLVSLFAVVIAPLGLFAQQKPLEVLIDDHIDAKLKKDEISPAPQASDASIIRRLTLDLVGRIPTPQETENYVQSQNPNKRAELVDRLMASPAYARYQAMLTDVMLSEPSRKSSALRDYLTTAIQENRPWDQMFREMLLGDETNPKLKGASDYLKPKLGDLDKLTSDVSIAFFGVNVSCAQCHDHPNVEDWTQDHFYGMKSFFARTYDAGGFLAERSAGVVKYKPNKGPEKKAEMMFLTGTVIKHESVRDLTAQEQKADKQAVEDAKNQKKAPALPAFSARAKLIEVALQPAETNYFARSIVNRLWHRFLGYGLVTPLDQMHSENDPSHPELLEALAADMAANKYNLNRLVRGLTMSKTYSRSSKYDSESQPLPSTFAVARLKPLTPQQLATSLKIAVLDPKQFDGLKPAELEKKLDQLEAAGRGFAGQIAMPDENFQIGVNEALLFSNSPRVQQEFLADNAGTLLGRLKTEKDLSASINLLIQTTLGRPATSEEVNVLKAFVEAKKDRTLEAQRQLLWALLTSPEFRFNH